MKNIIIAFFGCLLVISTRAQIQIDRSVAPKADPAPTISISDPATFKLKNGITVLVVEDHKLPTVSATFSIDQGPITEGQKAGVTNVMGQMLNEGTTTKTKAEFDEAVDRMGASVNLFSSGGMASALTRYFDEAVMLMADGLKNPSFPEASFEKIREQSLTGLKANEKSAQAISGRVVNALNFGTDHPAGEFVTEESLKGITLEDVKDSYKKYITPSRGYLTFVGDITPAHAKILAEKAFGSWTGSPLTLEEIPLVKNPDQTEIDLVDLSTAVQSEIRVTNLVNVPMSSPDYFPLILANQILGGGSVGRLFQNLREKHGFTYGAYSSVGTGRFQSLFTASAAVRNEKTDSAIAEILTEIQKLRTQPVSDSDLINTKAFYTGNFALTLENPATIARFASNILINDLPKDFYRTYLQKINAVTREDIVRVAKKYFNHDNSRIVVVGKAEEIKPQLEKLGFPVKLYSSYAEPVTETAAADLEGVNHEEIISKYIQAIGGAEALNNVKSINALGTMNMQGMNIDVVMKEMAPNMELMTMTMNGQTILKSVFDGKTGYQEQMGQKQEFTGDMLKEKLEKKSLFEQLQYNTGDYKIKAGNIEKVDGKDARKLNITSPSGKSFSEWYDVNSGLLLKMEKKSEANGMEVTQVIEYSDYKKVGNVLLPFTTNLDTITSMGSQAFTINLTDVKINEGVTEEDFK